MAAYFASSIVIARKCLAFVNIDITVLSSKARFTVAFIVSMKILEEQN